MIVEKFGKGDNADGLSSWPHLTTAIFEENIRTLLVAMYAEYSV